MAAQETPLAAADGPVFIHKHSSYQDAVIIPRATAQNRGLSFGARGLLTYMLSLPPDWELNEKHLIGESPAGRDGLRSLVRELEAHGYLHRQLIRATRGRLARSVWHVFDRPLTENPAKVAPPLTASPSTVKPSEVETSSTAGPSPLTGNPSEVIPPLTASPATVRPSTANPSTYKENTLTKKRSNKEEPPLPPSGGGAPAGPPLVNSPPDPNPSTALGPPDPSPSSAPPLPKAPPRFRPSIENIPAGLLPLDREILEFWAHKAGRKNLAAWDFLLGQLDRIQQHPQGGTETVRLQLARGIEADNAGKPWASVTFDNWWKFGREQQQRRVSQASSAFANVSAFLDAVEAAKR